MQMLITPEEARRLFGFSYFYDSVEPVDNLVAYMEERHEIESFGDLGMMAFLYYSGGIEGIREERVRNKKREKARKEREKYGYVSGAGTIPAFMNHHWNLYNSCCYKATQAMSAYFKAQRKWLESPEGIETMRRIEEYEEYIKQNHR